MEPLVVLVKSGPESAAASEALGLVAALLAERRAVSIFLVQDAVLCALAGGNTEGHRLLREAASSGAPVHCLDEDLAMRGFSREDLILEAQPAGYGELVDLLADGAGRTIGAY